MGPVHRPIHNKLLCIGLWSSPVNKKIALRKSQILNPWKCSLLFETMYSIPFFPVILSLCHRKYYMHCYHSEFKFLFRLKFSEYSKSILCISQPETSQSVFWGVGGRGNPSSDNAIMSQVKIFVSSSQGQNKSSKVNYWEFPYLLKTCLSLSTLQRKLLNCVILLFKLFS